MKNIDRAIGFFMGIAALIAGMASAIFDWQPSLHTVTWVAFSALGATLLSANRPR
jgi:membrane protein implicated in regulation of membrane protease activity